MRSLLVCAAAGALALASCSSSSAPHAAARPASSSSSAATAVPTGTAGFVLLANRSSVVSAGPPAHLSDATTKAAEALVRDYVIRGTVDVLLTGRLGKGFSDLFGPEAVAVLGRPGNDRTTVTELGYARSSGPIKARVTMHLTGLGDTNGNIVMMSASFKAAIRRGELAIDRSGELLLGRGTGGHWVIIGYNVRANRALGAASASTTTATHTPSASSTPGTKP